jgi:hypothetical protein
MEERGVAYRVLVAKPEGNLPLAKARRRSKVGVKNGP